MDDAEARVDAQTFKATVSPHPTHQRVMVVEVEWPRLSAIVDDRLDPTEVAERLLGNHFCVAPSIVSVDVRPVLDGR